MYRIAAVAVTVLALVSACSSSSTKHAATSTSTTSSSTSTTARTVAADDRGFCDAWRAIFAKSSPPDGSPPDQLKAYYREIEPLVAKLASSAPSAIHDAAATMQRLSNEVAQTGTLEPFKRPEGVSAQKTVTDYQKSHC